MTPTSDERREVAERLRIEVMDEDTSLDYPVNRIINDVLGVNGAWGAKAARILADLIDCPTCHICDTDHEFEDSVRCDRCRMTFNRPWEPFKYCPNCRAEVVDDE